MTGILRPTTFYNTSLRNLTQEDSAYLWQRKLILSQNDFYSILILLWINKGKNLMIKITKYLLRNILLVKCLLLITSVDSHFIRNK